jgi:type III secretion protein Q
MSGTERIADELSLRETVDAALRGSRDTRQARPPRLTRYAKAEADILNRWYLRGLKIDVPAYQTALQLRPRYEAPVQAEDAVAIEAVIGDRPVFAIVPSALLKSLLKPLGVEDLSSLGAETILLLLECSLSDGLAKLEEAIGHRIALTALVSERSVRPSFDMSLEVMCNQAAYPVHLRLPLETGRLLTEALRSATTPAMPDHMLPVAMAVELGSASLSVKAISRLRLNDVILFEKSAGHDQAFLLFGERLAARAALRGHTAVVIDQPFQSTIDREGTTMSTPIPPSAASGARDASFDDIIVKLTFEAGRRDISLGELKKLAPGQVFDLMRDPKAAVDIFAGQSRIGSGELVQINETVGVRITRLFHDE